MRGDGRLLLRGRIFWISYMLNGKEQRESSHSSDPKVAEDLLKLRNKERGAHDIGARKMPTTKARRTTINDLAEMVRKGYILDGKLSNQNESHLKKMQAYFGKFAASKLTRAEIDRYIEAQRAEGFADATINRVLEMLRACYGVAIKDGLLAEKPYIRQLTEDNVREGNFTETELDAVIAKLPDYLQDFTRWASITGQRKGELSQLTFGMLESKPTGDVLNIPARICKNRNGRVLPVSVEMEEILNRRKEAREVEQNGVTVMCDLIFHCNGKPLGQCQREWIRATKAANCPGRLFHDLRRFAVTNLIDAGIPTLVAMKVSGHKTESMFKRYGIKQTEEVREAMEKVEAFRELKKANEKPKLRAIK
jgi:integrase